MTTFVFKSPEGKEYEVNGPDGATKEQAYQILQSQLQQGAEEKRGYGPARSALQGMTFGFADEAGIGIAALAAKAGLVMSDKGPTLSDLITGTPSKNRPISDIYREMKDAYNVEQQQYEKAYPVESTALQIGGGLATGIAGAATKAGLSLAAHPIIGGGVVGAVAGAGQANRMEDVPLQSGLGAGLGLATGGAMRGLFGRSSASPKGPTPGLVGKLVSGVRGLRGPEQKAVQTIGKDLRASGITPQQAGQQLDDLGPQSNLADLSDNLARTARGVYTQKGSGAEAVKNALDERSIGGHARVIADLKRTSGKDTNFFETVKGVITSRKTESAPLYAQADKMHVDGANVSALHAKLLDQAKQAEGTRLSGALKKFAGMLKSGDEFKTNIKQLDIVKRQTRDMVTRAYRSGDNDTGKELNAALKVLSNNDGKGILEQASPAYRQANKIFSDDSSVLKALEAGKKVLSTDADEVVDTIAKSSLAEKDAYIQGATKAIRDKVLSGGRLSSDLIRERMRNAFPDEAAYKSFIGAMEREQTFAATKGTILGGSQTVNKAMDMQQLGIIGDTLRGNYGQAAMGVVRKFFGDNKIPERLHAPLAKALTTPEGSRRAIEILRSQGVGDPGKLLESLRVAVIAAIPQATPQVNP